MIQTYSKSSDTDPHYTEAIQEAFDNGVEIIPVLLNGLLMLKNKSNL